MASAASRRSSKANGLTVHSRPTASSAKAYGLPCRSSRSDRSVRPVSSPSSRQAVASGSASPSSTLPDTGAYFATSGRPPSAKRKMKLPATARLVSGGADMAAPVFCAATDEARRRQNRKATAAAADLDGEGDEAGLDSIAPGCCWFG
ncbi:hypothetical protein CDD83_5040 [Cordyceps sp. RAO-2017]|nr:hypothetical protein CDD83_5040 [Cordyceps sp. RAO-2017]